MNRGKRRLESILKTLKLIKRITDGFKIKK